MYISVIIPTYNEQDHIGECLDSLASQTYPNYEVIVVDDGSTDDTVLLAKKHKVKVLGIDHRGAGAARNFGSKHAKGEILVFVDADMTFEANFLNSLTLPITKNKEKGTFTIEEKVKNWHSPISKMWNYETTRSLSNSRLSKNHPKKAPVFRAILKSEFDKVGGFDLVGYNDDWTLSKKLGYLAVAADGAVMHHNNPETYEEAYTQSKWIGGRQYKFGELGRFAAFIRATIPFSIVLGIIRLIKTKQTSYILFKVIYDFGIFSGIVRYWFGGGNAR